MKNLTTKKAFDNLLSERGLATKHGKGKHFYNNIRKRHKEGKVSQEKMEQLLKEAGYKIVQPQLWIYPVK